MIKKLPGIGLILIGLVAFASCHSALKEVSAPKKDLLMTEKTLKVRLHETSVLDGLELNVLRIVSDSRCPSDATCVWEGMIQIEVALKGHDGKKGILLLNDQESGPVHGKFDGYEISLLGADPSPSSVKRLTPEQYLFELNVKHTP